MLGVKNLPANIEGIRDWGLIPGSGRFPGGGNGNPLQDRGQRNLAGYSPCGHKESDTIEAV